ncbi:aa334fad-a3e6-418c-964d-63e5c5432b09 [Thermothielavioides terrestris]|uniref:Aa334fad-a3e6-418c-964d-63e5c5432b09 n=1 Tax=Thermothielavioides terrestris TaxID=2587410 RepID=A0A446BHU2_9PEZI|nr:aa334fad-a3e6-418c-964d-63e5c5432b09 [Thermothielavioides terrestris]
MDPPSKKRGFLGFTGLFRSSPAPAADSDANSDAPSKAPAPAPSQREFGSASAPHSPMKRASESQLASRKIIGRPQGPSSKLSQSISASDIAHRPSAAAVATPRRMPGDNPNKPPPSLFSASAAAHAPAHVPKSTSFSGVTSTPRNIFRSSALYSRPAHSTFSPRVPANTLTQSFPPTTPGKPPRGSTADVNGRILANTSSSELFTMRIPSPPRHLTGEMLAKEVPDDPNRSGSIYADEFLAHYCPPDLDEHQRRQFFCILDLRRLKYAADEVFTKKDWKINILNFAKEYEKSRSLIMLRYGLYEFKTVRPSEAVKREWKQKHGIPDSDEESDVVPKTNGTAKRKAEEDLAPSSTLMASVSGANKRARAPETSSKNKRKADAEPDENHPAKLQKPVLEKAAPTPQKPPSATKSVFESIANNAQSTSFAKPAGKSLFASSTAAKPTVFDAAPKPAAATSNIFSHLSDESKGSGNEGADEESETSSNAEEDQSEAQDASQSDDHAASGGVSTPQFGDVKRTTTNGTSNLSSDGESTQGRSIFERITRGSDGQPIRKLPPGDGTPFAALTAKERSASPVKDQPAAAPSNNTWDAGTPIKFAAPAAPVSGPTGPKPPASSTIDFGAFGTKKAEETPVEGSKAAAPTNIFATQPKKAEDNTGMTGATPNGTAPNLFSFSAKTAETPAAAPPAFGGSSTSASATTSLSGANAPESGQQKQKEEVKDSTTAPATAPVTATATAPSLFPTQAGTTTEAPKTNLFQFGQNKTETAPATQPQFGGLFGKSQASEAQAAKPATSLFSTGATPPAGNIFSAGTAPATASAEEPAAKKFAFGSTDSKSNGSLFGSAASTPAPEPTKPAETKSLFGAPANPAAPAAETKSLFGSTPAAPATETKNLFGAAAPTPAQDSKPLFGGFATSSTESKPLFAGTAGSAGATESKPLFGGFGTSSTESKPLFGGTAGATESKPLFGGTAGTAETKPAGLFANPPAAAPASTAAPIFNFGASQTPATSQGSASQQQNNSMFGTGGSASFTFSVGGSDGSTIKNPFASEGTQSAPSSFNFGSGDAPSSTGTFTFNAGPTPAFSFGGASGNGASGTQQSSSFGATPGPIFNFGGSSQTSGAPVFSQQPPAATSFFGNSLAPGGGTSTGTNSPFTFGGASSLATTPAATTPEPSAKAEDGQETNADGDEAPQEQISLTDGGPGEEDESAVHEVRTKALKLVTDAGSDEDSGANADKAKSKNSWKVQGLGPLRILKNKTTGAVRMLLRAEPRGHIALNKTVLPDFTYKADNKYVKVTTASDDGKGLETWILQVKTAAAAEALAAALEEHKKANKK